MKVTCGNRRSADSRCDSSSLVRPNCWQKGFTLVEVVMAMAILGIGIMSVVSLQISNMSLNNSSRFHSEGHTLVMDQIEYLVSVPYNHDALKPQGDSEVASDGKRVDRGPYSVQWDVADNNAVIANSKRVQVIVSLNDRPIARGEVIRISNGL